MSLAGGGQLVLRPPSPRFSLAEWGGALLDASTDIKVCPLPPQGLASSLPCWSAFPADKCPSL
jgi:hypothetical protein